RGNHLRRRNAKRGGDKSVMIPFARIIPDVVHRDARALNLGSASAVDDFRFHHVRASYIHLIADARRAISPALRAPASRGLLHPANRNSETRVAPRPTSGTIAPSARTACTTPGPRNTLPSRPASPQSSRRASSRG